jgi:pentose-5-phosphate-3-epimerase
MNQNPLMCFNGEIRAVPVFIAVHLKQSWIHYDLTETHFSPNLMDNILLNEMSELTTSSDS